jgi:biopolymer transport protein ExbD
MPKKQVDKPALINEELLLNILLDKENAVWYYEGSTVADLKKTIFANEKGIRDIIYWKQNKLQKEYGSKDTMICIIKAADDATYENMVDALDEMDITGVKRYALQDIQPLEIEAIKNGGTPTLEKIK